MSDALIIEVVRKTVTVDCTVEEAFRVFTADALSWWPVESHSIHQTVSEIVFEPQVGGQVYEVSESGSASHTGVDRRCGRPVQDQLTDEVQEAARGELSPRSLQLLERPPADRRDVLGVQPRPGESRPGIERRRTNEVVALDLSIPVAEIRRDAFGSRSRGRARTPRARPPPQAPA